MKIFMDHLEGEKSEQLEPAFLLEYLKPYPDATLLYLEYLVNNRNSTVRMPDSKSLRILRRE